MLVTRHHFYLHLLILIRFSEYNFCKIMVYVVEAWKKVRAPSLRMSSYSKWIFHVSNRTTVQIAQLL